MKTRIFFLMWVFVLVSIPFAFASGLNETSTDLTAYECEAETVNVLQEGEEKTWIFGSKQYKIVAEYIDSPKARLEVNGETTDVLTPGDSYMLNDGAVLTIFSTGGGDLSTVRFCINGLGGVAKSQCVSTNSIGEGYKKTFQFGDKEYEVNAIYSSSDFAKLALNGEITDTLVHGQSYVLVDGSKVSVISTETTEIGDVINFCLDGAAGEEIAKKEPGKVKPSMDIDLANYPDLLISNNQFNAIAVVGYSAPAEDIISSTDIINGVKEEMGIFDIPAKLSSDIIDPLAMNLISVGNPSNNEISAKLLGSDPDYLEILNDGEGIIKLFNYNGYVQILVAGSSNADTRKAAKVLANWKDQELKGTEIIVSGSFSNPVIGVSSLLPPVVEEEILIETAPTSTTPTPTCYDGIKNQDEEGVDCGGTCKPCVTAPVATCTDGVKNDGETGVDCGGPCTPCQETKETCNGCITDSTCLPFGTRLVQEELPKYCDITKAFSLQKEKGEMCQNNYECETNQCTDGICGSLAEELRETRGMLQKILDWINNIFG